MLEHMGRQAIRTSVATLTANHQTAIPSRRALLNAVCTLKVNGRPRKVLCNTFGNGPGQTRSNKRYDRLVYFANIHERQLRHYCR